MGVKINSIRSAILPDGIMLSKWLRKHGITNAEQSSYVKHGTLERIATGVYKFPGETPSIYGILNSYGEQGKLAYHIGALSSLEIKGFSHYIMMGRQKMVIFTPLEHRLPKWIKDGEKDIDVVELSSKIFGDLGIEDVVYGPYRIKVASPERAIMECILLSPKYYDLMHVFHQMEMLTNLRSKLIQALLENCTSIRVKRMFLYMAKKSKHRWYEKLDISKVYLGSGPREYAKGGIKDPNFNIIISKELFYYE